MDTEKMLEVWKTAQYYKCNILTKTSNCCIFELQSSLSCMLLRSSNCLIPFVTVAHETGGLRFRSCMWDRGCTMLRSPIVRRNGSPILPGFQRLSNLNSFMITMLFSVNFVLLLNESIFAWILVNISYTSLHI